MASTFMKSSMPSYYIFPNSQIEKKRLICVVCGSIARGYNFGAITCMSCKIFFRRNALTNLNSLHCHAGGNCEINQQTRKCCTYCRLLTCFRVGMKRQLFRLKDNNNFKWFNVDKRQHKQESKSNSYQTVPNNQLTLPILRSFNPFKWTERFQLSHNDWILLNQLSISFDTVNYQLASKSHQIYRRLLSIGIQPVKMRAKASYVYDIVNNLADAALNFIKSIPQFISLSEINKQAVLMRNARSYILFYAHYQMNLKPMQTILETPYWQATVQCILLPSTINLHHQIKYHIGRVSLADPYLIKLILPIIIFSANNIDHNAMTMNQKIDEYHHAMIVYRIQNLYAELLWKYIVHRYGEAHSILRFTTIVQTILRSEKLSFTLDNSMVSFEHKFYENVVNSINKTL